MTDTSTKKPYILKDQHHGFKDGKRHTYEAGDTLMLTDAQAHNLSGKVRPKQAVEEEETAPASTDVEEEGVQEEPDSEDTEDKEDTTTDEEEQEMTPDEAVAVALEEEGGWDGLGMNTLWNLAKGYSESPDIEGAGANGVIKKSDLRDWVKAQYEG